MTNKYLSSPKAEQVKPERGYESPKEKYLRTTAFEKEISEPKAEMKAQVLSGKKTGDSDSDDEVNIT